MQDNFLPVGSNNFFLIPINFVRSAKQMNKDDENPMHSIDIPIYNVQCKSNSNVLNSGKRTTEAFGLFFTRAVCKFLALEGLASFY